MSDRAAVNPHRFYGTIAGALGAFAIALGIAELVGLTARGVAVVMLAGSILAYALVAWSARATTPDQIHLGGRGLTPFYLGLAGSVDCLGAVFLIAVPAMIYAQGAIGLTIVLGSGAAYLLAGLLFGAGLARSGQLTVPGFLARRYESDVVGRAAALVVACVGFGFALAQVAALAQLGIRLFGLDARLVYGAILVALLACAVPGGAAGGLRAQAVQAMVALVGFILPVLVLSARFTGIPLPQVMYGPVVQRVERMEAMAGLPASITALPDAWTFVGLVACLAFGIAVLPQLLGRHLAAPDTRGVRRVTGWSLLLLTLMLAAAPAYAVFVKSEVLANILGQPISALPNWIAAWSGSGASAVAVCDAPLLAPKGSLCAGLAGDGDGLVSAVEFRLLPEALVLITPAIADLPFVMTALAATGFVAAALAAIGGAIRGAASALTVDLMRRPQSLSAVRLAAGGLVVIAVGVAAALEIDGLRLALSILAVGACALFPLLAFGIWSRRSGAGAALAGMLTGVVFCLAVLAGGVLAPRAGSLSLDRIAAAMLGLPIGLLVHGVVSHLGTPAGRAAQSFVDRIRLPRRR